MSMDVSNLIADLRAKYPEVSKVRVIFNDPLNIVRVGVIAQLPDRMDSTIHGSEVSHGVLIDVWTFLADAEEAAGEEGNMVVSDFQRAIKDSDYFVSEVRY